MSWFRLEEDRSFISKEDVIAFLDYYDPPSKCNNRYTPATSMVLNLKKKKGDVNFGYKQMAIEEASHKIETLLKENNFNCGKYSFVPIPSSACVNDFDSENAMAEVITKVNMHLDLKKIFTFMFEREKSHLSSAPRDPDAIRDNLLIDEKRLAECRPLIILIDDVLTTGAHFSACKAKILEHRPKAKVYGLMLTVTRNRRNYP